MEKKKLNHKKTAVWLMAIAGVFFIASAIGVFIDNDFALYIVIAVSMGLFVFAQNLYCK